MIQDNMMGGDLQGVSFLLQIYSTYTKTHHSTSHLLSRMEREYILHRKMSSNDQIAKEPLMKLFGTAAVFNAKIFEA